MVESDASHPLSDARATRSVCPQCLRPLPAWLTEDDEGIFLERNCPDHGLFRALVWEDADLAAAWGALSEEEGNGDEEGESDSGGPKGPAEAVPSGFPPASCPSGCATCTGHLTRPCCVLLEVTSRCDLGCPVCFAQASRDASCAGDPSLETISGWYDAVYERAGAANIQLSGGEPTIRDDLPRIIELGIEKGFSYFQVNTNGLRLASDPSYAHALKEAGASCVFLQFDGVTDEVYRVLRGRPLLQLKRQAIAHCAQADLPVVLVPTVALGVNDDQLGDVVRFALRHSPTVRGVHIQPLARFGRFPQALADTGEDEADTRDRLTIPGVLSALDYGTDGMVAIEHFRGGSVESPYCSFSASYRIEGASLVHIPSAPASCCGAVEADGGVQRARKANALRWGTDISLLDEPTMPGSLDAFLQDARRGAFSITGMAFMDAQTLDLKRLQRCYIFIVDPQGALVPFCAYNLTAANGEGLYRRACRADDDDDRGI